MSRRASAARCFSALLVGALVSCSSSHPATGPRPGAGSTATTVSAPLGSAARRELRGALDRAIAWSASQMHRTDPFTLVLLDYLHRRFAIAAFADARAIAVRATAHDQPASEPELRMLRPGVRPSAASLRDPHADPAARLVSGALGCDQPGTPPGFDDLLVAAIAHGGYELTHAAVAIAIEADLGCAPTGGAALRSRITAAIAIAVAHDTGFDDISIERMAMLALLDAGNEIPRARLVALVGAQQRDGGWPGPDVATRAHTTALAIWTLSAALGLHGDAGAGLVIKG